MKDFKLIVAGGRDFNNWSHLQAVLFDFEGEHTELSQAPMVSIVLAFSHARTIAELDS